MSNSHRNTGLFPALLKRASGTWETTRQALVHVTMPLLRVTLIAVLFFALVPWSSSSL